jgi:hypothetical protein
MSELVDIQLDPSLPQPQEARVASDLIIPARRAADRLAHFPEEVYDLRPESHLSRLMKVLLGDAGVGRLRKLTMKARLQTTLSGTNFYDLDQFWGMIFGVKRTVQERFEVDPYVGVLLAEEWEDVHRRDALFRSRISQLAQAVSFGATPIGIELLAEALLSVDCEVEEDFSNPSRRLFVVVPKRQISAAERYDLTQAIERMKTPNTVFEIEPVEVSIEGRVPIRNIVSSSELWEVISKVSTGPLSAFSPYQKTSGLDPVEQPRPAFSGFQGEAWSYLGDLQGVLGYSLGKTGEMAPQIVQRTVADDGSFFDYPADFALASSKDIFSGRFASDAMLVSTVFTERSIPVVNKLPAKVGPEPYGLPRWHTDPVYLSSLYADKFPLGQLREALRRAVGVEPQPTDSTQRFWVTESRDQEDQTEEVWVMALSGLRRLNYVAVETAKYPHTLIVEIYRPDRGEWNEVARHIQRESQPARFSQVYRGHPEHMVQGSHWERLSRSFPAVSTNQIRVRMIRTDGAPPLSVTGSKTPYTLAIRGFDAGYRIKSPEDLQSPIPLVTNDVMGNPVTFELRRASATRLLDDDERRPWKSEPQPVNYSVVNLYLDVRDENNDPQVIDRLYIEPLTVGVPFNIYVTEEDADTTDAAEMDRLAWHSLPLSFVLQKGWIKLPPTRSRFFKLEFTGLAPEPYENLLGLTRSVQMFPKTEVNTFLEQRVRGMDEKSYPPGLKAHIVQQQLSRYSDQLNAIEIENANYEGYSPTDSFFIQDPVAAQEIQSQSWTMGFQPWHSGTAIPRFIPHGPHAYQTLVIKDTYKMAFFVGISRLEAYRFDATAMDDTKVYTDFFGDTSALENDSTWDFNPHRLFSGGADDAVATSKILSSRRGVVGVQFATLQTEPKQYIYDDDFRDPALNTYDFKDADRFHVVGDATVRYISLDHAVRIARVTESHLMDIQRRGQIVQPLVKPTFHDETLTVDDIARAQKTWGGISSPALPLPHEGRVNVGVRGIFEQDLQSPLFLRIINQNTEEVLAEKQIYGLGGQMFEESLTYRVPAGGPGVARVVLVQEGKADNAWRVNRFSYFDDSIIFEMSNDDGGTWHDATPIRNNAFGVLTFPTPDNRLRYRIRATRKGVAVSGIRIRPIYDGKRGNRRVYMHRGPNVSAFDIEPSIEKDPWFTFWSKPLPWWWYYASRRFPPIAVSGVPDITTFKRFYARTATEYLVKPFSGGDRLLLKPRVGTESLPALVDAGARLKGLYRVGSEFVSVPADAGDYLVIPFRTIVKGVPHNLP